MNYQTKTIIIAVYCVLSVVSSIGVITLCIHRYLTVEQSTEQIVILSFLTISALFLLTVVVTIIILNRDKTLEKI